MNKIANFYDQNSYDNWKIVLGDKLHYHTGICGDGDIFENTVREISNLIEKNSKILDCGCGWGGPARYFINNKNCQVTGITISEEQYRAIKDFEVILADIHNYIPNKSYDCALFMESLTHMQNPKEIVKNFSETVDSIVIRDYIVEKRFENKQWNMFFRTKQDIIDIFEDSPYKIDFFSQTDTEESFNNFKASAEMWLKNLEKLPDDAIKGQLKLLKCHSYTILYSSQHTNISFFNMRATK